MKKSEKPESNIHDTEKPIYKFTPGLTGHEWKQQGPYLICHSCDLKHSIHIGMGKLLVGIKNGKPVLEKR